jgi:hypothetical protein
MLWHLVSQFSPDEVCQLLTESLLFVRLHNKTRNSGLQTCDLFLQLHPTHLSTFNLTSANRLTTLCDVLHCLSGPNIPWQDCWRRQCCSHTGMSCQTHRKTHCILRNRYSSPLSEKEISTIHIAFYRAKCMQHRVRGNITCVVIVLSAITF